jgi:hypothetical protein
MGTTDTLPGFPSLAGVKGGDKFRASFQMGGRQESLIRGIQLFCTGFILGQRAYRVERLQYMQVFYVSRIYSVFQGFVHRGKHS